MNHDQLHYIAIAFAVNVMDDTLFGVRRVALKGLMKLPLLVHPEVAKAVRICRLLDVVVVRLTEKS
ncbi:MAG: hypothetical protein GKR94_23695 [Gammaproteobacteria bacterium]|nr:hypothetical protein [Gammaproteobacteria bacterium]